MDKLITVLLWLAVINLIYQVIFGAFRIWALVEYGYVG